MTGRRSYLAVKWPNSDSTSTEFNENEIKFERLRADASQLVLNTNSGAEGQSIATHFMRPRDINLTNPNLHHPSLMFVNPISNMRHRVTYFSIEFQLKPLSERGLLIYFGAFDDNYDQSIGYVSVSLQGGVVEFRLSGPNNQISVVRSVRILAMGEWHKIKLTQSGRRLTLWVEGHAATTLAQSGEVFINRDAPIFVGGMPDLSRLPHNAVSGFPVPYRGCIRKLIVSGSRLALNETNIVGKHDRSLDVQ